MQRYIQFLVSATALLLWASCSLFAQQPVALINPSFESGTIGQLPTGWQTTSGKELMYVSDGSGLSVIDPSTGYDGSRFATATWEATGAGSSPFPADQSMGIYQQVDLSSYASLIDNGDQGINLSFVYNDNDPYDIGEVSLDFYDDLMAPLGGTSSFSTSDQGQNGIWTSSLLSGEAPVGARSVRISLAGSRLGNVGTARNISFDDLSAELDLYVPAPPSDVVHGTLTQFNQNAFWCWYQDERAIVDQDRGELLVGSIANRGGLGGENEDGKVQTTHFNLATRSRRIVTHDDVESYGAGDDHNAPAYLEKEDGDIMVFYAGHNRRDNNSSLDDASSYHTFDATTETWGPANQYHWWPQIPSNAPGSGGTSYSNVFQLSAEDSDGDGNGRIYNIARTQQSPHIMYSDDNGATWEYGGQLTEAPVASPAGSNYVNGYYKYWSNGTDRIDLIATEYHPRDFNTSIFHAYIQGGKMYDSQGNEIDADIFDAALSFDTNLVPSTDDFTPVFLSDGVNNSRAWNSDVMRYPDGTIATLFKTRPVEFDENENVDTGDHRVWYGRFNSATQQWTATEIAKAGTRLYSSEQDYTGLGALDPQDPNTLYISTEINPITDTPTDQHEIYKGVTTDDGTTWTWTAITENSTYDNLRPIIPQWDDDNTALLWWRGTYSTSQYADTAVVGLILSDTETQGDIHYVDATLSNTTLSNGNPLTTTSGPSAGATDNLWHIRTDLGNDGTVFTADESSSEDVPRIKTTAVGLDEGLYDVFAYFWVDGSNEWRIGAGLSDDAELPIFRIQGAQHAEADDFGTGVIVREDNRDLFQAYLGRADVAQGGSIEAFIDDYTTSGDGRVWYDGIGYALVSDTGPNGDFDGDGDVDVADLVAWQRGYGSLYDQDDLIEWRTAFGSANVSANNIAVPEPSSALPLLIGIAAVVAKRSFGRRGIVSRRSR